MRKWVLFSSLLLILTSLAVAEDEARLLRFPAIYNDQIVFTYAGDLYTVAANGGIARKLTNHEGVEIFPRFSPDGQYIAFTGQYDGNTEVYLIPAEGGIPKRLTYTATLGRDDVSDRMGPNNIVMGWKNKSKEIVFRSRMKSFNPFIGELFAVDLNGDLPEQLPLPRGGFCSFSPDDQKLAYNRVFREFRTWKRYRGGMADDIWIYDFKTKKTENITNNPALDIIPMWSGNKIYFLSDRDENQRMNLFVYDLTTKETTQLTNFVDFDIKFPSLGNKAIVFENGGFIYKFDLTTNKLEKVTIYIADDRVNGREEIRNVSKNITNFEISPDGKRALFGARGDVFTVPAENGPTRNLTTSSGIHERNSKWSPDGKWIAYVSDRTGEDEIYIQAQDGSGVPIQITQGNDTYIYQPHWSPDSKKLLWGDRRQRLRYVDIETKQIKEVYQSKVWEMTDYSWSPDSKWIAFTRPEYEGMNKICMYSLEKNEVYEVTDGWYESAQPVFSSDGKYLFFVSNRDFNPIYSWTEWNHAYQDMQRIYFVTLSKETKSPFEPKSDEVEVKKEETKAPAEKKDEKKAKAEEVKQLVVKVDVDGLKDRIVALPIQASSYGNLASVGELLYYTRKGSKDEKQLLFMYDLSKQKETELGQVDGYEVSADQKKMLVAQAGSYAIIDLPKAKISIEKKLDLSGMEVRLDHQAEWAQIFEECWRQMREYFYVPNMHGVDWKAMKEKYQPLVKHVNHRIDLTYIIGEMIGELNVGHTYVGGGDMPQAKRVQTGLLGAQIVKDRSGYFQIKKILKGQNWSNAYRSPLTEIGVNANEGDFIVAVNGQSTKGMNNIYQALVNTVGKQVKLRLNTVPSETGSREVTVVPIADEANLYYLNWVEDNIRKVTEATDGKVGYIHIPDMGVTGLNEFVKYYYPQLEKKALIIDVRGNGGGNVSPMIIERLRREAAMITIARNRIPTVDPAGMVWGPKVCLINEFSASDGDIFPYRFRQHKLGKLIGKRTWGGVVGIRGTLPLLDGGYLNKPEFSRYDLEGKEWIMEGVGVEPDIYVDNDPAKEFAGIDEQLNKAIEVILEELKTQEKTIPAPPPLPVKVPKK
ncbi:MAG: PDZ domain-containing protein [candidate division KSB1 bacterium]|nr:PDZ domain-containing protein [candidate division KSB1 bacterium]MDZ7335517.1 PDZ domain-containing protein [candidate division KSB1 bacterium]MDZ7357102.1 PDZ domain-containing protein [candidate division KSB1 bacterium]MDZ7401774.1 PDZ domain-containing protein [candidate division KSB1 bacterium]